MENEKNKYLKKLDEHEEEKVGGGYIYGEGALKGKRWEVIDDNTGDVLGRYSTEREAKRMAKEKHQTRKRLSSWEQLSDLRHAGK